MATAWKSQGKLENSGNSMSSGKSGKTQGIPIFSLEKYLFCDIDKKSFECQGKNIHMQPTLHDHTIKIHQINVIPSFKKLKYIFFSAKIAVFKFFSI